MHLDVLDLRNFYYRTRLGRAAQKAVRDQVGSLWSDARGMTVAGFGFTVPLLRPFLDDARRVTALMPGQQGVMAWPPGKPNVSVLCEETLWPIDDNFADRLIVMHGIETSENPMALLDECYRVLAPEGRGIFIVPNRAGMWARREGTPFAFGRPYTLGQIESQLRQIGLIPKRHTAALYQPPYESPFWSRVGPFAERVGPRVSNRFAGGVLIVEVTKQIPAPPRGGLSEALGRPLRVLDGIAAPEPRPA